MTARTPAGPAAGGPGGAGPKVVAFGGGHGLAASLRALRRVTDRLTAVVTVADDGGSSGRLRQQFPHLLPPGDLRMALAALADPADGQRLWTDVVQHRFSGAGDVGGHAAGNLLISALTEVTGDVVTALDAVGALVGACGRVLPMATVPLEIVADVVPDGATAGAELEQVRGQVAVASTTGRVVAVRLDPADPPACGPAVAAVAEADWVVFGPGSWFTSVLPHLMVPELAKALGDTTARRAVVLNLAPQAGETHGFSPETHLEVFASYAHGLGIDVVVAERSCVPDPRGLMEVARDLGAELVLAPVACDDGSPRHDPERLATVFAHVMGGRD